MELKKKLLADILSYCKENGLDENEFYNSLVKKAFMLEKYGDRPSIYGASPTQSLIVEPEEKKVLTFDIPFSEPKEPKKKTERKTTKKKAKEDEKKPDEPKKEEIAEPQKAEEGQKTKRRKLKSL